MDHVSYDKELRTLSKNKQVGLFTIDYNGGGFPKGSENVRSAATIQGPMSPAKAKLLWNFMFRFKTMTDEEAEKFAGLTSEGVTR